MTADVHTLAPAPTGVSVGSAAIPPRHDPTAQDLLRELRDMLFVIAAAATQLKPEGEDRAAGLFGSIAEAALRASDRARLLQDRMADQPTPASNIIFDVNARLRAQRATLEALLPPGGRLGLRLAAEAGGVTGDPARFDQAVAALVRDAADAMWREARPAPIVILTGCRPSAGERGLVRVSVVSDIRWMPAAESDAAQGGQPWRGDHPGHRPAAHIELRRAGQYDNRGALDPGGQAISRP